MAINLYDVLFQTAERNRNHPAILGPGINERRTYGELLDSIRSSAARLDRENVVEHDHLVPGAEGVNGRHLAAQVLHDSQVFRRVLAHAPPPPNGGRTSGV